MHEKAYPAHGSPQTQQTWSHYGAPSYDVLPGCSVRDADLIPARKFYLRSF